MARWWKPDVGDPAPGPEAEQDPGRTRTVEARQAPVGGGTVENLVNIGKSIEIKGELSGNEDLTIEGKVDGKVFLRDHSLTVGANGRLTAEVHAKTVTVVGEVIGNITADDRVEIAATGSMQGDICAPRVALADGARFKGSIDMEPQPAASRAATTTAQPARSGDGNLPRAAGLGKDRQASL